MLGWKGLRYASNSHVQMGDHLRAHEAVCEFTTQIVIVVRIHQYTAELRFLLIILSSL